MQAPIRFGVFELDLDRVELRKAGTLLRMRPQPLKLLALLAAYAGELVTREKIRQELWSAETNVDFEQGVNRCIKEIRSALDDDADTPRYIKTVHRRGYIFIAPVHGVTRPPEPKHEIKQSQLTTHSHEASITTAAISPDGSYLAYSDGAGLYVRLIDSGETHALRTFETDRVSYISWFPNSTNLLVSGQDMHADVPGVWVVSIFGGVFWKVTVPVGEAVAVADGLQIAFIGGSGEEIWLMKTGGENRRRIFRGDDGDRLANLAWVADGRALLFSRVRIGLYRFEVTLEYLDLASEQVATVLSDARLRGSCLSSDGRLVYALAEAAPRQSDVNFWESRVDMLTREVVGKPSRITNWTASNLYSLSITGDGKRLAFLKGPYQANV